MNMKVFQRYDWAFSQGIPTNPRFVLLALCRFSDPHGKSWPSVETLQQKTGLSRRSILYCIKQLKALQILSTVHRHNQTTIYYLHFEVHHMHLRRCTTCTQNSTTNRRTMAKRPEKPGTGPPYVNCIDCSAPFHWTFEQDRCRHCQKIHNVVVMP